MSKASTFLGGSIPVGAIVTGQFASDPKFLPCDGADYVSASYPTLDKTNLSTWGSNAWVARTLPTSQRWNSVAYGAGVFVAVGANAGNTAGTVSATSPDGITWTNRTIPSGIYYGVVFAGGQFLAFGASGVLATSPDGITWTARTSTTTIQLCSMAYGNGLYVAVGATTSTPGVCVTSPDGITWTSRNPVAASEMIGMSVIFAEGRFLMLPSSVASAASNRIYHSVDGVSWSSISITVPYGSSASVGTIPWGRITYFKGLLILSGVSERLFISRDMGITWATVPTGFSWSYPGLISANGILFMPGAVPASGTSTYLWYSFDGFRWSRIEMPSANYWLTAGNNGAQLAFGANTYLAIIDHNSAGANTTAATLAIDTTKFRTPPPSPLLLAGDPLTAERTFIKAA